jgi:putative phosphoribosyl transferase
MVTVSREEAGRRLSHGVALILNQTPLVLAVSPGGFKVAAELARQLGAPLDVMAVSRLEVPGRRRSVFGAVADRAAVVLPERIRQLELPSDYVYFLIQVARAEVERVTANRRGSASAIPLDGRPVVLVDDGVTDTILLVGALTALRQAGARTLVFAAPHASVDLYEALNGLVDERVLLNEPGTPAQVRDPSFSQTTERDVHEFVRHNRESLCA